MDSIRQKILYILKDFEYRNKEQCPFLKSKIIIIGSACGAYMDYFELPSVTDVDIYPLDFLSYPLFPTKEIDIVLRLLVLDGWEDRVIEKDGFMFLSPLDLLVCSTAGALIKMKPSTIAHTGKLLNYLNMTVDEFMPILDTALANSTERNKPIMVERKHLLYEWYGGTTSD